MWYDIFSVFYDHSLEDLYAPYRAATVAALKLPAGATVLDVPCGTGQSLPELRRALGPGGTVVGVDASRGMLRRARRRMRQPGGARVVLHRGRASGLTPAGLESLCGRPDVDGVLCALGPSALPNWNETFEGLFQLLRPGGRFVIFDAFAATRTTATRTVELVARAHLDTRGWAPLAARCTEYHHEVLPADASRFGGELYLAAGTRPAG